MRPGAPGKGRYGGGRTGGRTLRPAGLVLVDDQGRRAARGALRAVAVDRLVDFLPVDRHVLRRDDAQPHLVTANLDDRDDDVVVDYDAFVFFPRQDKHGCVSFPGLSNQSRRGLAADRTPSWAVTVGRAPTPLTLLLSLPMPRPEPGRDSQIARQTGPISPR